MPDTVAGAAVTRAGNEDLQPVGKVVGVPDLADVLRADIGQLRRGFSSPQGRSSRTFRLLAKLLDEKRGHYQMRILYCPPLSLLWSFLPGDGSPASFLHKFYVRQVWRERGVLARLRLLAALLVCPVVALSTMAWVTWLNGAAIKSRTGKGIARQMLEQLYLVAAYDVLPPWYYIFELFDDAKRRRAGEYLHRFETKGGIFRFLKRTPRGASRTPLSDKLRFAARCHEHGLPSVPVLLTAEKGEFVRAGLQGGDPAPRVPEVDLFVKPAGGRGGFGAERWHVEGSGRYSDGNGRVLTTGELLGHIRRQSLVERCVVQPRLVNHPDIADLSNGALSTVRILTIENERGEFEPTHAVLRMAVGSNTTVDNFHAGGIAAKVDLRTGELGRATDIGLRPDRSWCASHPDTHARIQGRVLPFWPETLALASRAHAAFADRVLIGWDVAILEDGPVLIEGNAGADVDIVERTHGEPLGDSRFGELIALHLHRAVEGRRMSSETVGFLRDSPSRRRQKKAAPQGERKGSGNSESNDSQTVRAEALEACPERMSRHDSDKVLEGPK